MRTYPSSEDVLLLPRSLDTISRPHLQCTISTPKGAFLAELSIVALDMLDFGLWGLRSIGLRSIEPSSYSYFR